MTEDWIESKLQQAHVPPSGDSRERTIALAQAIAPARRTGLRGRVARPRVVVPLAVLMIAAMTAPGQAATSQVGSIVSKIVPARATQTATVVGTANSSGGGFSSSRGGSITTGPAGGNAFRPAPNGVHCGGLGVLRGHSSVRAIQGKSLRAVPVRPPAGRVSPNAFGELKAIPDRNR